MINWLKVKAFQLADKITLANDPFDEFKRKIVPAHADVTLDNIEQLFFQQIQDQFLLSNGIFTIRKTYPGEAIDLGDQALWHGMYCAMLANRYMKTKDDKTLRYLTLGLAAAWNILLEKELLVRGRDPVTGRFEDDASNDTLTGILAACFYAKKAGVDIKPLIFPVVNELLDHDYSLVDQDGKPTTFGKLEQGILTDPLRLTLLLACLKVADVAGHPVAQDHYVNLRDRYRSLIPYALVQLKGPLVNLGQDYDVWRAAMHLQVLKVLDTSLFDPCTQGLQRIWRLSEKSYNPFLMRLCFAENTFNRGRERLTEFDPLNRGLQLETDNTSKLESLGLIRVLWKSQNMASQPLPFWMMDQQDFFWQRNLFSLGGWKGYTDERMRFSGLDFLCAYWF